MAQQRWNGGEVAEAPKPPPPPPEEPPRAKRKRGRATIDTPGEACVKTEHEIHQMVLAAQASLAGDPKKIAQYYIRLNAKSVDNTED